MLKYALLAGVMTIAAPAVAQQQTNTVPGDATSAATPQDQTPSGTPVANPQPSPATPMDSATRETAAPATTAPADAAAAQPATGATQVATVVQTEFPTYDANKDGKLEKTEFASWMVKLKQASDPKASATDPATRSWVNAAFAQADKDKNKTVSPPELVGFLSQGQS